MHTIDEELWISDMGHVGAIFLDPGSLFWDEIVVSKLIFQSFSIF
jgi:hypothetical protein